MPYVRLDRIDHYYERHGDGTPIVFVHGAFVDCGMWDPQWSQFSLTNEVIRYDLRGHGKTVGSASSAYSVALFADDLKALIDELGLEAPIVCGLSLGGMIAQDFAVRYPRSLRALVLANTAVSVRLTFADKVQRYLLFPRWALELAVRLMGVAAFTRLSFWLARVTRSERWLGRDRRTRDYIRERMLAMKRDEYLKVYRAIYDFGLRPLEAIECPTLVLIGEHESALLYRHAQEVLRRVRRAQIGRVPDAGHMSNMENPEAFNRQVAELVHRFG